MKEIKSLSYKIMRESFLNGIYHMMGQYEQIYENISDEQIEEWVTEYMEAYYPLLLDGQVDLYDLHEFAFKCGYEAQFTEDHVMYCTGEIDGAHLQRKCDEAYKTWKKNYIKQHETKHNEKS